MKTLKEKIEVMQAALDGKEIQAKIEDMDKWVTIEVNAEKMEWDWAECDYRIKHEPMEFWVNVYKCIEDACPHETKEKALKAISFPEDYIKTIKVREVIE